MIKKTITYTDYNGETRTDEFFFNLNKAELIELEMSETGGYTEMIRRIVSAQDMPTIIKVIKELISKSYGEKSPDGKRFIKSQELSNAFMQTEAYTELFMEIAQDADKAAEFFNGVVNSIVNPATPIKAVTSDN